MATQKTAETAARMVGRRRMISGRSVPQGKMEGRRMKAEGEWGRWVRFAPACDGVVWRALAGFGALWRVELGSFGDLTHLGTGRGGDDRDGRRVRRKTRRG